MYESGQLGDPLDRFERELGASLSELERGLDLGAPGQWDRPSPNLYRIRQQETELHIEILSQGERRIASLAIPLLKVVYRFKSGSDKARRTLLARLDLAMQRGGG